MNAERIIAVLLVSMVVLPTATTAVAQQGQNSRDFVKITYEDILPAKALQNITASDSGWIFGYDLVGYIKKVAIEDIPTTTSIQEGVFLDKKALQSIRARESGYAIGFDGYGNLVKLPISAILTRIGEHLMIEGLVLEVDMYLQ